MSSDKTPVFPEAPVPEKDIHHPSQTRHDTCFIPECVREYAGEPLFILVAWWCLQQQDWVYRSQISEAFHIPARRASYLMAYLRNKTRRVVCDTREVMLPNKVLRYEIRITRVEGPQPRKKNVRSSSRRSRWRVGNADSTQANALWNQLCTERNPSGHADPEEDDDETPS
ncbi:TPA: CaiF/GrlA family transcriptional regulator [Salmonella enterica]|nr:CaiF/GrlA family transcriptional regulator [Salmonella enterica]HCL4786645.1 CaiF/GrlA family transcriptional regulator [Salmonella enterica]